MTSVPFMPFYIGDYLKDTRRLSTLEHGAYMLLIMEYWCNGSLPKDDRTLARIAGVSDVEWGRMRDVLAALFKLGEWRHKRLEIELEKATGKSTAAREAAKIRWQDHVPSPKPKRKSKRNADAHTDASPGAHTDAHTDEKQVDTERIPNADASACADAEPDACDPHMPFRYQISESPPAEEEHQSRAKRLTHRLSEAERLARSLVGEEPVLMAQDFHLVEQLLDDGCLIEDIEAGIKAAMAAPNFRPRSWERLVGWVRRAAKDRLAAVPKKSNGHDGSEPAPNPNDPLIPITFSQSWPKSQLLAAAATYVRSGVWLIFAREKGDVSGWPPEVQAAFGVRP